MGELRMKPIEIPPTHENALRRFLQEAKPRNGGAAESEKFEEFRAVEWLLEELRHR
jgi:hypothetical protein